MQILKKKIIKIASILEKKSENLAICFICQNGNVKIYKLFDNNLPKPFWDYNMIWRSKSHFFPNPGTPP